MPSVFQTKCGRIVRDGAEDLEFDWAITVTEAYLRDFEAKVSVDFWMEGDDPDWVITSINPDDSAMSELYEGMPEGWRKGLFEHICRQLNLDPDFIAKIWEEHEARA